MRDKVWVSVLQSFDNRFGTNFAKKELKESKPRIIAAYVLVQLLAKSLSNV